MLPNAKQKRCFLRRKFACYDQVTKNRLKLCRSVITVDMKMQNSGSSHQLRNAVSFVKAYCHFQVRALKGFSVT